MMKNELDIIVDDLLARWHHWRSDTSLGKGFRTRDATCKDARSQWTYHDRDNGVLDAHIENEIMKAVDRAVDRTAHPWHHVIMIEARNLWSGLNVWSSMRLPTNDHEVEVLRIEARNKLLVELQREGCIGG